MVIPKRDLHVAETPFPEKQNRTPPSGPVFIAFQASDCQKLPIFRTISCQETTRFDVSSFPHPSQIFFEVGLSTLSPQVALRGVQRQPIALTIEIRSFYVRQLLYYRRIECTFVLLREYSIFKPSVIHRRQALKIVEYAHWRNGQIRSADQNKLPAPRQGIALSLQAARQNACRASRRCS